MILRNLVRKKEDSKTKATNDNSPMPICIGQQISKTGFIRITQIRSSGFILLEINTTILMLIALIQFKLFITHSNKHPNDSNRFIG